MIEPKRGQDGLWRLRWQRTGHYVTGDDDKPLTFPTKAEADKARRERERGMTGIAREQSDVFLDRARRRRYR